MIKSIPTLLLLLSAFSINAQLSKSQVTANIEDWYAAHSETYSISISGKEATVAITRYHPERPEEKNDLLEINWRGMRIQLKFDQPLASIGTHSDSLQNHFSYLSLHHIYNDINAEGWAIYPRTPQSSLRGKGVKFNTIDGLLNISIDWSIYTVMGYKDSKKCRNERSIADGSVSEGCMAYVRKKRALKIMITGLQVE